MKTRRAVMVLSAAAAVALTPVAAMALRGSDGAQGQIRMSVARTVQHRDGNEPGDDRIRGRHVEPGDDRGRHAEAGDDRVANAPKAERATNDRSRVNHTEPGDDHGHGLEPGDDHGNHDEPGDDHGGHGNEPGDDHGGR